MVKKSQKEEQLAMTSSGNDFRPRRWQDSCALYMQWNCNNSNKKSTKNGRFPHYQPRSLAYETCDARQYLLLGKGKAVFQERCRLLAIMSNENKCEVLKMWSMRENWMNFCYLA